MKVHNIPFQNTGYFSKLICDYLDEKTELSDFYNNYPDINGFKNQIELKRNSFKETSRDLLVESLKLQYEKTAVSNETTKNISALLSGHNFYNYNRTPIKYFYRSLVFFV